MKSSTLVRLWQTKSAARTLSDLLFWSDAPDPAGLPENWAPAYREKIRGELRAISNAFEPGHSVQGLVKECERLAIEFIGLMDNSPGLSIRPRHEWTVPSHCRLFDRLAEIRREFERLADSEDEPAPVVQQAATRQPKTRRTWTRQEVNERIELELSSKDPEQVKQWLFASGNQIAVWIGCDRKTVFETTFWTENRGDLQQEWRRNNVSSQGANVATKGRAGTKRN